MPNKKTTILQVPNINPPKQLSKTNPAILHEFQELDFILRGERAERTDQYVSPRIPDKMKTQLLKDEKYTPIIILVAPQMGENIGATARAMKNFNISQLRIISPRDGWPNEQARSMAVAAVNIIDNAKIYDNLESGIQDIDYLYATSATARNMNKNYIASKNLYQDYPSNLKVGIMFGRESCGLLNQEIIYANKIININTGDFGSLNLAQAVVIICYELFHNSKLPKINNITKEQKLATRGELEYFFDHLFRELNNKHFFKVPEKKLHMTQNIMNIFTRIDKLSNTELQTLRGIITTLSL